MDLSQDIFKVCVCVLAAPSQWASSRQVLCAAAQAAGVCQTTRLRKQTETRHRGDFHSQSNLLVSPDWSLIIKAPFSPVHHPESLWLRRSAHWESSPSSSWQQGTCSERVGSYSKTRKNVLEKYKTAKYWHLKLSPPNPTLNLTPAPNQAQTLIPNGNAVLTYIQTVLLQYLCSPLMFYLVCGICFTTKIFQKSQLQICPEHSQTTVLW